MRFGRFPEPVGPVAKMMPWGDFKVRQADFLPEQQDLALSWSTV